MNFIIISWSCRDIAFCPQSPLSHYIHLPEAGDWSSRMEWAKGRHKDHLIWYRQEHHLYYPQGHQHHSCRFFSEMQFIVLICSNASSHDRRIKYNTKMFTTCWEPIIQMMLQSWIKLSDINMSPCLYTMCTPQQQCDLTKSEEWQNSKHKSDGFTVVSFCAHTIAQ